MLDKFSTQYLKTSHLLGVFLLAGLTWGLGPVSCANGGGSGGGGSGTIVTTPNNAPCNLPTGTCTPSTYGGISGIQIPGLQTQGANGYCGCPSGLYPIYNSNWGIACVPSSYMTAGNNYYGYNYNTIYAPQNYGSPGALQQVYYNQAGGGAAAGGYNSIAAACALNTPNACIGGASCVPIANSSTVGVCSQGVNGSGPAGYGNTGYNGGGYVNGGGYSGGGYATGGGYYNGGYNGGYGYGNGYNPYGGYNGYNGYGGGYGYGGGANSQCYTNSWGFYICGYIQ